jgi:NAD+--dinitrogen-reductase ADP-D-ribosyltransferase
MERIPFNRCNLPPWIIASRDFNDEPRPLEIQGVAHANRFLFEKLDGLDDPAERARTFDDWLAVRFQLHQWQEQETQQARKSLKNSYLRFLRGWGHDSNAVEGAVLKGWVESRMGIPPIFHRSRIERMESAEYQGFARDRMQGMARTSAIFDQLDLVYTFTQRELARRRPEDRWVTLYRGQNDANEHEVVETLGPREQVVRLNNLCSFTDDVERAWEFGSTVWEAKVAVPRIFCVSWFFPGILRGEREVLVVGGEMRVKRLMV